MRRVGIAFDTGSLSVNALAGVVAVGELAIIRDVRSVRAVRLPRNRRDDNAKNARYRPVDGLDRHRSGA